MFSTLLFTIVPTILFYLLLSSSKIKIKSKYLKIAFSWFGGLYISIFAVFLLALIVSQFNDSALTISSFAVLLALEPLLLYFIWKDIGNAQSIFHNVANLRKRIQKKDIIIVLSCLIFSFMFFAPHLIFKDGSIYTSPIYWDFHWHVGVIQNFVYGNNFPPQYEAYAGVPMTYHFFGDFVFAIYSSLGLPLVGAMNVGSILVLFFVLLAIIGCGEEFFHSKRAGIIAAILVVTTGSMHFIYFLSGMNDKTIWEGIASILGNTQHPWKVSFIEGNPNNYNGTMFNMFYFLQERHMLFGILYLLFSMLIFYKRESLSTKELLIAGVLMGAFFYWHLYITIMVVAALVFLLLFGEEKKKTFILLAGSLFVFLLCFAYVKSIVINPAWFTDKASGFPQLNTSFAGGKAAFGSPELLNAMIEYYRFAYGFRLLFLGIGLFILFKTDKQLFRVTLAFLLPTMLLINNIVLSPDSSENHKWLRPVNIIFDLTVALAVFKVFFDKSKPFIKMAGVACMIVLTLSGIIELMPFLNSKPTVQYAPYTSAFITSVRAHTTPQSVFAGKHERELHLAGRKLYLGNNAGPNYALNKEERTAIVDKLYQSASVKEFCELALKNKIDFVEADTTSLTTFLDITKDLPSFTAVDRDSKRIKYIDVTKGCAPVFKESN